MTEGKAAAEVASPLAVLRLESSLLDPHAIALALLEDERGAPTETLLWRPNKESSAIEGH